MVHFSLLSFIRHCFLSKLTFVTFFPSATVLMSDSPSPTPIADPNSGLSPEEIAENDLCDRMSSPSPGDGFDDDQLALDQDSSTLSSELLLTSAASMHNELVVTHRKATQLKLHPYQCTALEEFVKVAFFLNPVQ